VTASAERLHALASDVVAAHGYDLEDLSVTAAGKRSVVRVLVDKDGGVTLDDVADVSRALGAALDAADEAEPDLLGDTYVLEVSSPGVDRPLTEPRHWRRAVGRLVTASLRDGAPVTGRVLRADESGIALDVDGTEQVLAPTDVVSGAVQVEFSRKGTPVDDEQDEEEGA
jgi:ribosome maturation factor RimP